MKFKSNTIGAVVGLSLCICSLSACAPRADRNIQTPDQPGVPQQQEFQIGDNMAGRDVPAPGVPGQNVPGPGMEGLNAPGPGMADPNAPDGRQPGLMGGPIGAPGANRPGAQGNVPDARINNPGAVNPLGLDAPQPITANLKQRSENIKTQLKNMREIDQANVIVIENTALVGYKPSRGVRDMEATRNMIADKVKAVDTGVAHVVISESTDIMTRIGKLANDIANNRPMNEVNTEAKQIIQKVNPTMR